jgi:hypothetical protein
MRWLYSLLQVVTIPIDARFEIFNEAIMKICFLECDALVGMCCLPL